MCDLDMSSLKRPGKRILKEGGGEPYAERTVHPFFRLQGGAQTDYDCYLPRAPILSGDVGPGEENVPEYFGPIPDTERERQLRQAALREEQEREEHRRQLQIAAYEVERRLDSDAVHPDDLPYTKPNTMARFHQYQDVIGGAPEQLHPEAHPIMYFAAEIADSVLHLATIRKNIVVDNVKDLLQRMWLRYLRQHPEGAGDKHLYERAILDLVANWKERVMQSEEEKNALQSEEEENALQSEEEENALQSHEEEKVMRMSRAFVQQKASFFGAGPPKDNKLLVALEKTELALKEALLPPQAAAAYLRGGP